MIVLLPVLVQAACGEKEQRPAPAQVRSSVPERTFGENAFVMVRRSPDRKQTVFEGGSYFQIDEKGRMMSPGGVVVVVDKAGMEFGGTTYALGSVLLVGEKDGELTYRKPGPGDRIVLKQPVTVFGKTYPAGRVPLPPSGNLEPPNSR
jgi:hypothetical protein